MSVMNGACVCEVSSFRLCLSMFEISASKLLKRIVTGTIERSACWF